VLLSTKFENAWSAATKQSLLLLWQFAGVNICTFVFPVVQTIGASTFLRVRKIFARISPNLPEKLFCDFCVQIFSHKDHESLICCDFQKKVFICFPANVGRHCLQSNNAGRHFCPDFQGFCPDFQRFCPNFQGFCPNFQGFCPDILLIKTFGSALAPPVPPASYTTDTDAFELNL